jgi:hypothetical protein
VIEGVDRGKRLSNRTYRSTRAVAGEPAELDEACLLLVERKLNFARRSLSLAIIRQAAARIRPLKLCTQRS